MTQPKKLKLSELNQALAEMKIDEPPFCEFGSHPSTICKRCNKAATHFTSTGYKCCKEHAPWFNGEMRAQPIINPSITNT